MIVKVKNVIISSAEENILRVEIKDIEQYLSDVREAVEILLSLTPTDFSEILQNEHKGFEHEQLYVFGKDVTLLERNGTEAKTVSLYIKLNRLENCFIIVTSFHEQKYPFTYYFK